MALKGVLFDYGHTLVDFTVPEDALHDVYVEIRERLVAEARVELPQSADLVEVIAGAVTKRVDESYVTDRLTELDIIELFRYALGELGLELEPETVRWVAEKEHEALASHLDISPSNRETLEKLRGMGLKIGVVSNAHLLPYMMRRDWTKLGIADFVDSSAISSEIGVRKPHRRMFETVLSALGLAPNEAIFVGDRLFDDVGGAHSLGMPAILTQEFRAELVEPGGVQPEHVVARLPEIIDYIADHFPTQ